MEDKSYECESSFDHFKKKKIKVIIPNSKNRKNLRKYGNDVYKTRRYVENAFLKLKR